jgi:hypothetical protein
MGTYVPQFSEVPMQRKFAAAAFALALLAGCEQAPAVTEPDSAAPSLARGGQGAAKRAAPLTNLPISQDGFVGTLSITHIGYDETTGQLLFSGRVTRTADGVSETFTDVPGTLGKAAGAAAIGGNEPGVCDILFLDIGPISLDLLGLLLDVAPIQIDLDADPGAGNLLGNLLCAVAGLLDGGGLLADILGILDRINGILDLLNNL